MFNRLLIPKKLSVKSACVLALTMTVIQSHAMAAQWYASPTGSTTGNGTLASPWDLQSALNKSSLIQGGDILNLLGGTYVGSFTSTLAGGANPITVRSLPGQWAKIDGYVTTSLAQAINSTTRTITFNNASTFKNGDVILVGTINPDNTIGIEQIQLDGKVAGTNTFNHVNRGWGGTTPIAHEAGKAVTVQNSGALIVNGSNTIYRDFEVMNSMPVRAFNYPVMNTAGTPGARPEGIFVTGHHTKFINLVVHDNAEGFGFWKTATDSGIYGCIIYNNGHVDTQRGHGHGIYTQNEDSAHPKRIANNISVNNFATGMKAYGEQGVARGYTFDENINFNNASNAAYTGSPAIGGGTVLGTTWRDSNLLVGTAVYAPQDITITNNSFYYATNITASNLRIGYIPLDPSQNLVVTGNRIMGGTTALSINGFQTATVTGNKLLSRDIVAFLKTPSGLPYTITWDDNTYYDIKTGSSSQYCFNFNSATNAFGGGTLMFDQVPTALGKGWRQWTGFDVDSSIFYGKPTGIDVVIQPNEYEPGRAHLAIYNWNSLATVPVDLTDAGLTDGYRYALQNTVNYFGDPVLYGIYDSAHPVVNIPMNSPEAMAVATAIGHVFTPATTSPEFAALVLLSQPAMPGDFNGDLSLNAVDLTALEARVGQVCPSTGPRYDLVVDGYITTKDVQYWVENLRQLAGGDANLDDLVNDTDKSIVLANQGQTGLGWTGGDFNFDGVVNELDMVWFITAILGDLNRDEVVNNQDIAAFVLALTDPDAYAAAYPTTNLLAVGDINGDQVFNNQDIAPFVSLLTGGSTILSLEERQTLNSVPEPISLSLLLISSLCSMVRRGRRYFT